MATLQAVHTYKVFGQDYLSGHLYEVADAEKAMFLAEWRQVGDRVVSLFHEVTPAVQVTAALVADAAGATVAGIEDKAATIVAGVTGGITTAPATLVDEAEAQFIALTAASHPQTTPSAA